MDRSCFRSIISMSLLVKVRNLYRAVRQNGGVLASLKRLYITDDLKWGTHVGTDKYGNKYYENNYYFMGKRKLGLLM